VKTSLSHLPEYKQTDILEITDIIKSVVAAEKIILFGSYAKGGWVEDEYLEDGIRYQYISDYDFVVVTDGIEEKEFLSTDKIVNQCRHRYKTPVNVLIHDIHYINEGLQFGQYFFSDIVKEGVLLHDTGNVHFTAAKELSKDEHRRIATKYYDQWFESAVGFVKLVKFCYSEKDFKKGAFLAHQAAENFYNTVLLVCTGYKPKTHNLEKLRQYVKAIAPEVYKVIPKNASNEEAHLFDLLKRGYIDARYKNDYVIKEEELEALVGRIEEMKEAVESLCDSYIDSFKNEPE